MNYCSSQWLCKWLLDYLDRCSGMFLLLVPKVGCLTFFAIQEKNIDFFLVQIVFLHQPSFGRSKARSWLCFLFLCKNEPFVREEIT